MVMKLKSFGCEMKWQLRVVDVDCWADKMMSVVVMMKMLEKLDECL
jgi:hypothetical protein